MSQVTLESVEIIEIQTFVIGLPVGPTALTREARGTEPQSAGRSEAQSPRAERWRARGGRRGLRRVGDSRPGRGDRGERLEKDAGLRAPARAPGTRRGESWQADRNNVWSLRTSGLVVRTTRGRSTVSYLFGVGAGGGVEGAGSKTTVGSCVGVVVRGAAMFGGETGGIL